MKKSLFGLFRGFIVIAMAVVHLVYAQASQLPPVYTDAPGNVFFHGEPAVLKVEAAVPGLRYTLLDWHGNTLSDGEWPQGGGASLEFAGLPNGYYVVRVATPGAESSFNFTVIAPNTPSQDPGGSFFGVDSAQSWLAVPGSFQCRWYGGDSFRVVSDLLAWAGVPNVRERLAWGVVNPSPGEFQYGVYQRNAELLQQRGILVSGMFHDAPKWTDNEQSLPTNLLGVFQGCRSLARDFGGQMGDWEFWNEEDIGFSAAPVWDYAAALKAASLGFRAGRPDIIVAPGALCAGVNTLYHQTMYRNDIAKYTDVMNYHTYVAPAEYAVVDAELRKFCAANGMPGRAVWITECGTQLEGHSTQDGVMAGFKAHSPRQEMLHAEFYPKSQLYHQMQGVARNFFFVFPPYNEAEGRKDWGMMRRDGSVKPAYAAMATMLGQIGDARLLGEVKLGDGLKAFLLEKPDHSQVLVFWQLSAVDSQPEPAAPKAFDLPLEDGDHTLVDMLGTPVPMEVAAGTAHRVATRYPAYLAGLHGLSPDVPAVPPGTIDRHADAGEDEDLAVVIRAELAPEDFTIASQKSVAEMSRSEGKLKVMVWNLDDISKTGSIHAEGGGLTGLPSEITLPPFSKTEFDAVYCPALPEGDFLGHLVLSGTFNGRRTTRLDIPVKQLEIFLANCRQTNLDSWLRPSAWERNTSASTYECAFDETENALRFSAGWNESVDRWFYPVHQLGGAAAGEFKDARGIQFEVKSAQDKVENDFACAYVMVGFDQPGVPQTRVVNFAYESPLTNWEVRRVMFDQSIPADATVKFVRIGCNPRGTRLTYWIRNITLFSTK